MTDEKPKKPEVNETDAKFSQPITNQPQDNWDARSMPNLGNPRQSTTGVTSERDQFPSPELEHLPPQNQGSQQSEQGIQESEKTENQIKPADAGEIAEAKADKPKTAAPKHEPFHQGRTKSTAK